MIISLLLPLLLVRKRKNIRSSFETRSLGKLVKMMIRWLTDFLCVWVVSFKTIFEKKKESGPFGFPPHRSAEFVLLKIRASATKETSDHWEEVWNKKNIFFFWKKLKSTTTVPLRCCRHVFSSSRNFRIQDTASAKKKNNKSRKKIFCQYFWNFLVSEPPEYFFFLVTNENFYLSLSVCVCVSWKRKNFLAVFVVFRRHLLEELAVKYVWTQNWIILDATIFGLDKTCRESICESLTFAHSKKKYLPANEIETFQEPEVGQKKRQNLKSFGKILKKNEFARENEKCPRAPEKKWEKFAEKIGNFFFCVVGTRRGEKKFAYERKKNVGVLLSFCSPVALEMARFCAEANNGGIKENILRKQRILRKRRRRKEKRNHHSSLPQRDISHCIRINCWNNQVKHKCCPSLLLHPPLWFEHKNRFWFLQIFNLKSFRLASSPFSFDFPR